MLFRPIPLQYSRSLNSRSVIQFITATILEDALQQICYSVHYRDSTRGRSTVDLLFSSLQLQYSRTLHSRSVIRSITATILEDASQQICYSVHYRDSTRGRSTQYYSYLLFSLQLQLGRSTAVTVNTRGRFTLDLLFSSLQLQYSRSLYSRSVIQFITATILEDAPQWICYSVIYSYNTRGRSTVDLLFSSLQLQYSRTLDSRFVIQTNTATILEVALQQICYSVHYSYNTRGRSTVDLLFSSLQLQYSRTLYSRSVIQFITATILEDALQQICYSVHYRDSTRGRSTVDLLFSPLQLQYSRTLHSRYVIQLITATVLEDAPQQICYSVHYSYSTRGRSTVDLLFSPLQLQYSRTLYSRSVIQFITATILEDAPQQICYSVHYSYNTRGRFTVDLLFSSLPRQYSRTLYSRYVIQFITATILEDALQQICYSVHYSYNTRGRSTVDLLFS